MASRREFEMAFQLSAQLKGSYYSTFKNAQASLASMQKEIAQLHKAESNITAYEKKQVAVTETQKKLDILKAQYKNLQDEMSKTGKETASLKNQLLSKQMQIDKTTASLEDKTKKLNEVKNALQEVGVDTGNLTEESKRLEAQVRELKKEQKEAAESEQKELGELKEKEKEVAEHAQEFGEKGVQAMDAISTAITAAGIATVLNSIAEAYMECINAAGGYEAIMSEVEALSGASKGEMEELSQMAKKLGAETKFTAQESAEAMTYMAMAGWETADMLQGIDGVIQLAAASGEELGRVSDIVTDNLTAFNMKASDTAHFSDVLAAAATNSNTNVSIMGETFKQSASIAGALGYSVDDVAVAVGLMANSGIKGSIAGTALKNTFNGLLEGATLAGEALGEYEFSAKRSDGTMKSFSETIQELRVCFNEMSEAEKVNNAMTIAGERGYNGLLAILNATDDDYQSLTQSIENCTGAANRMAAIKLDNMKGQLTLAQSAWESVTIAIGEQFTPAMSNVYQIAAKVFGELKEFIEEYPAIVKAVTAFVTVIGTAVAGLTAYATIVKVIKALNMASLFTGSVGIILGTVSAVAALTAGVVALVSSVNESVPSVKELTTAAREMDEAMLQAVANQEESSSKMLATASIADSYIQRLEEIEAETNGNVKENQEYHNILALLTRTIPELADSISLETNAIEGGTEALKRKTEAWKTNAKEQAKQEYLNSLYDEYSAVMSEAAENSIKLTQAQIRESQAIEAQEAAQVRMNELYQEAEEAARKYNEETGKHTDASKYLTDEYYALSDSLWDYNEEIRLVQKEQKNLAKAIEEDNAAVSKAEAVISETEAALEKMTEEERKVAEGAALVEEQQATLSVKIGATKEAIQELTDLYYESYEAALESISGQYSLWDKAAGVTQKSVGDMNNAMESQITYWQNYNTNLTSLSERSKEIEGLGEVIASFADGSQESVNAIAGMVNASDTDLQKMVENWKVLQEEQQETAGSVADLKTNFTEEMDQLGQELEADIEAMNLSEEAQEAGRETIQGFINGANAMTSQVESAYAKIAKAAESALHIENIDGKIGNQRQMKMVYQNRNAYATGTVSAEAGFAEVGENGPELIFLHGGEKILTAAETARVKRDIELQVAPSQMQAVYAQAGNIVQAKSSNNQNNSIVINNNPTINIDGNKPDNLEEKLEENNRNLLQMIRDLLDRKKEDERRSVYA